MSRGNCFDASVGQEFYLIDAYLTMKTAIGVRVVVAVINNVVVIALLQYAMMTWTMNGTIGISLEYASLVFVRPQRLVAGGILHTISMIVAGPR